MRATHGLGSLDISVLVKDMMNIKLLTRDMISTWASENNHRGKNEHPDPEAADEDHGFAADEHCDSEADWPH